MKINAKIILQTLSVFMLLIVLDSCREPEGCMNPDAVNYDIFAEVDDGSCTLANAIIGFQSTIDGSKVGGASDSIGDYPVSFDTIEFDIEQLTLTTEKETVNIDASILKAGTTYDAGELKVADLSGISFNINSMTMKAAVDVDGDEKMLDLFCNFNAAPIQIETDTLSVNRIDYEINVSFDVEKFFDGIDLSMPDNISCPNDITNTNGLFYVK